MLLMARCRQAVALPRFRAATAVYFSDKTGGNDDEGDNTNELDQLCISCGCPSGCNSVVCYDKTSFYPSFHRAKLGHPGTFSDKAAICHTNARKYGHNLPQSNVSPEFETLPNIPTGVFRCTVGELLGPQGQAHKRCQYLNPEYFSFHHMTFYDFHYLLSPLRSPAPNTNRKP